MRKRATPRKRKTSTRLRTPELKAETGSSTSQLNYAKTYRTPKKQSRDRAIVHNRNVLFSQRSDEKYSLPLKTSAKRNIKTASKRRKKKNVSSKLLNKSYEQSVSRGGSIETSRSRSRKLKKKKQKSPIRKLRSKKSIDRTSKSAVLRRKQEKLDTEMLPILLKKTYRRLNKFQQRDLQIPGSGHQDLENLKFKTYDDLGYEKKSYRYEVEDTLTDRKSRRGKSQVLKRNTTTTKNVLSRSQKRTRSNNKSARSKRIQKPNQRAITPDLKYALNTIEIQKVEAVQTIPRPSTPEKTRRVTSRANNLYSKSVTKLPEKSIIKAPGREYTSIQSSIKSTKYYKSSLSKYYIRQLKHNCTRIGGIYYEHFQDSCQIMKEHKFWRVKKMNQLQSKAVDLSKIGIVRGKVLLLDMDECLIHSQFTDIFRSKNPLARDRISNVKQRGTGFGFWMDIEDGKQCWVSTLSFPTLTFTQVRVYKRPFVEDFLRDMSQYFDLVLFTASQKEYATKAIALFDPRNQFFKLRLFRTSCIDTRHGVSFHTFYLVLTTSSS